MNFSIYPLKEIYAARDNFYQRWQESLKHSRIAKKMYFLNSRYPPTLSMPGTEIYPFMEADQFNPQPDVLFSHHHDLRAGKKRSILDQMEPSKSKRILLDRHISGLTERALDIDKALALQNTATLDVGRDQNLFYDCDICTADNMTYEQAKKHVARSKHQSCSQYNKYSINTNDTEEDRSTEESAKYSEIKCLVLPREINNPVQAMYGWKVGDCIVCCPSCSLIFPDKLLCAYHHQVQHYNRRPSYMLGKVMAANRFIINFSAPCCHSCKQVFHTFVDLLKHWKVNNFRCSPFDCSKLDVHLLNMKCGQCDQQRDRYLATPSAPDVKPEMHAGAPVNDAFIRSSKAHYAIVMFMVHLKSHFDKALTNISCSIHYRFVSLPLLCNKNIFHLPPYSRQSHETLLISCLNEAKRLLGLLKTYKKQKKSLIAKIRKEIDCIQTSLHRILNQNCESN